MNNFKSRFNLLSGRLMLMCVPHSFAELLRKSAEHTLMDMVQLLFSRLPQFKEDPKWATSLKKVRHRLHDLVIIKA